MKALRYFIMPVVLFASLIGNVYAGTPAYIKLTAFSALGNGIESFFKTIYYLLMFALILAATYYVTKFLARKGMGQSKTKHMKLLESMPLGVDKSLHLVKVGTQYFMLGTASKSMFMISELEQDKLFEEQLNSAIDINEFDYDSYDNSIEAKDFSTYLNSVKSNLYKLKSMVRGNNRDEIK
jgi:flagellar protein FliO/FliZ